MEADEKLRVLEAALRKRERELFELRATLEHERGVRAGWIDGTDSAINLIRLGHSLAQPPPSDGDKGRALLVELVPLFAGLAKEWLAAKAKTREDDEFAARVDAAWPEPDDTGEDEPAQGQAPGILGPWQAVADNRAEWRRVSTDRMWQVRVSPFLGIYSVGQAGAVVEEFLSLARWGSPLRTPLTNPEALEELKHRVDIALVNAGVILLSDGVPCPGPTAGQASGILSPWQTSADDSDLWLRSSGQGWQVCVTTVGSVFVLEHPAEAHRLPGWRPSVVDLALDFVRRSLQISPTCVPFPSHEAVEELKRRVDEALAGVGFILLSEGEPEIKAPAPATDPTDAPDPTRTRAS